MNNQTLENNENNRGGQSKTDLESEIRSTWLGVSLTDGTPFSLISSLSVKN